MYNIATFIITGITTYPILGQFCIYNTEDDISSLYRVTAWISIMIKVYLKETYTATVKPTWSNLVVCERKFKGGEIHIHITLCIFVRNEEHDFYAEQAVIRAILEFCYPQL